MERCNHAVARAIGNGGEQSLGRVLVKITRTCCGECTDDGLKVAAPPRGARFKPWEIDLRLSLAGY